MNRLTLQLPLHARNGPTEEMLPLSVVQSDVIPVGLDPVDLVGLQEANPPRSLDHEPFRLVLHGDLRHRESGGRHEGRLPGLTARGRVVWQRRAALRQTEA